MVADFSPKILINTLIVEMDCISIISFGFFLDKNNDIIHINNQSCLLWFYGEIGHDFFQLTYESKILIHDPVHVLMRQKKLAYLHIIPTYLSLICICFMQQFSHKIQLRA